jgi:hypothetical protein
MFKKCYTHIIMVAMVTYFFVKYEHFWFEKFSFFTKMLGEICCHSNHDMCKTFYEHSGFFFLILAYVHKMFYTYYHGCHGNIFFFQKFGEKWKLFKSSPFFFILFLKRECKKNIRNVQKGKICCHGNHDKMCLQSFEI